MARDNDEKPTDSVAVEIVRQRAFERAAGKLPKRWVEDGLGTAEQWKALPAEEKAAYLAQLAGEHDVQFGRFAAVLPKVIGLRSPRNISARDWELYQSQYVSAYKRFAVARAEEALARRSESDPRRLAEVRGQIAAMKGKGHPLVVDSDDPARDGQHRIVERRWQDLPEPSKLATLENMVDWSGVSNRDAAVILLGELDVGRLNGMQRDRLIRQADPDHSAQWRMEGKANSLGRRDLDARLQAHKAWLASLPMGRRADLRGARLRNISLEGADLRFADCRGADFTGSDLSRADFRHSDMRGACMSGTTCVGARFTGAKLEGCDMAGVDLRSAEMDHARMRGADLGSRLAKAVKAQGAEKQQQSQNDRGRKR